MPVSFFLIKFEIFLPGEYNHLKTLNILGQQLQISCKQTVKKVFAPAKRTCTSRDTVSCLIFLKKLKFKIN